MNSPRWFWSFVAALALTSLLIWWAPWNLGTSAAPNDKPLSVDRSAENRAKGMEKDARGWDMKTGADADARKIDFNPVTVSIAEMNQWHEGKPYDADFLKTRTHRIAPYELQVYRVEGTIVSYQCMRDGDYRIVMTDDQGHKIVAELPNPPRVDAQSPCLKGIAQARAMVEHAFPMSTTPRSVERHAILEGPAYFGLGNPKWDHADNYVQIHPLMGVRFIQ